MYGGQRFCVAGWRCVMRRCPLATRWNVSGRKWRWRATTPLPVYALAITRFAVISRNCGGLKPWPDNTKRRSSGPSGKHRWRCLPAGTVQLVHGGELRRPREEESVSIRFKAPGVLHIVGRNGGRKLKKIWQEQGIPPRRRDTTPLLFYGETLIAAAGVFVTREGAAEDKEGVSLVWHA